jgi:hypothetical protein
MVHEEMNGWTVEQLLSTDPTDNPKMSKRHFKEWYDG